ncbi:dihydrolipoamide acetyltransferase component of pyruvate dehydrogenase complex [Kurthia zopfii]|uniref:Dihydrolipoamide acetyltransferase component of pyruvate dehydrogenase complex n=1 Tax=Kurthia zopfii TaxID=1650 RepID=A0A8B4QB56_9BACL|nr:dihydrolipoamide acetyltransferase family protein [Kurthia zopfii]PWI21956.1 branched-chain alpha-keto acid dehydrogenase subunit E2 [Kurthia zopfii]TDR36625.1 branched-chain alpha-keto acid dehydrogenase E2 component [Kurthia zopfii]GEK30980.1 dihydrolipoamide acetyltransferase component of pyruvate dehydrogenase complex [Kurthia zopfii]STX09959.1 Dihydrolipoyllysine-residue succinyltransferase component of 2-oxoglutarate dehydrogenase complex [Kurthia zopfii]
MLEYIKMPQLGESVTEGTIDRWLVKPGDQVEQYDSLAELTTDKVTADLPSQLSGTIQEILVQEGETVAVGEIVCSIVVEHEGTQETSTATEAVVQSPVEKPVKSATKSDATSKKRVSPVVGKLIDEYHLNIDLIEGTGSGGRVTRKDVMRAVESGIMSSQLTHEEKPAIRDTQVKEATPEENGDVVIPVTSIRKTIAKRMTDSVTQIPHAWMTIEVDVTDLVKLRNAHKNQFKEQEGYNLTYFAFFVKAVAQALKEYPMMNSVWKGDSIIQKKAVNMSIAVASDDELFVPVIQNCDQLSIAGIASQIASLAEKGRKKRLSVQDMSGGTFTVNNTGSFGSVHSAGIINAPQAAILQVESIVKKPVIIGDGMFAARDMVNLCLSLDHRILDGLICGKFLARVKELLENMNISSTSVY